MCLFEARGLADVWRRVRKNLDRLVQLADSIELVVGLEVEAIPATSGCRGADGHPERGDRWVSEELAAQKPGGERHGRGVTYLLGDPLSVRTIAELVPCNASQRPPVRKRSRASCASSPATRLQV